MSENLTYEDMEKQLQELHTTSDEKFKQLLKNSFDILVLLDSNGIQHFVSESCEKILGYKPEELINIPVIEKMIHPEDQEKTLKGLKGILENKEYGGTQYRHRHKNGGWVYLEAFGTNQLNNPAIKSVVLNVRDITMRKNAEQALKESEKRLSELNVTKDRFFSIIAHDLKTPFQSILGLSELLYEQVQDKNYEGLEKYAQLIQKSSQQAFDLLTNLLEWARSQTGRIEFKPENLDLAAQINSAVELLNDYALQKSISITRNLPASLPVLADKAMIETILRNLISNAIKFTSPGGKITITAESKKKEVVVSVSDNGVGIEKENLEKLFRIDHSHSTPGTQRETGTGLGLLICKEFVDLHGGRIWVNSESGKGSTFYFALPSE